MSDFFTPWRRKVGCVTLVLACVFAVEWVRSGTVSDYVLVTTNTAGHYFASEKLGICWIKSEVLDLPTYWGSQVPIVFKINARHRRLGEDDGKCHRSQWFGFQSIIFEEYGFGPRGRDTWWVIPYWSIVIPLTMISAYLLLSKSRTRRIESTHV